MFQRAGALRGMRLRILRLPRASGALGAKANAALTNPKAQTIGSAQIMMMASAAGNIAIAAQDFVIE